MKIKTSELIGAALDWAVFEIEINDLRDRGEHVKLWVYEAHVRGRTTRPFSTDWAWGGPIIERELLTTVPNGPPGGWYAAKQVGTYHDEVLVSFFQTGPTPLIAAMRCYVASKLGDEVEVPDNLGAST